jgi:hypothetical protein
MLMPRCRCFSGRRYRHAAIFSHAADLSDAAPFILFHYHVSVYAARMIFFTPPPPPSRYAMPSRFSCCRFVAAADAPPLSPLSRSAVRLRCAADSCLFYAAFAAARDAARGVARYATAMPSAVIYAAARRCHALMPFRCHIARYFRALLPPMLPFSPFSLAVAASVYFASAATPAASHAAAFFMPMPLLIAPFAAQPPPPMPPPPMLIVFAAAIVFRHALLPHYYAAYAFLR